MSRTSCTVDALAVHLRGVQLRRAVPSDAASVISVATSCVSFAPTSHASTRQRERTVSNKDVQACLKYGVVIDERRGALRLQWNGVTVICRPDKTVITTWRHAHSALGGCAVRLACRIQMLFSHAFMIWKRFPVVWKKHIPWLLNMASGSHEQVAEPMLRVTFRAWVIAIGLRDAKRVYGRLARSSRARAMAAKTVAVRNLWPRWQEHARTERTFREAFRLIGRYQTAYLLCDTRRALCRWRRAGAI